MVSVTSEHSSGREDNEESNNIKGLLFQHCLILPPEEQIQELNLSLVIANCGKDQFIENKE
jgi:hypothetical protein